MKFSLFVHMERLTRSRAITSSTRSTSRLRDRRPGWNDRDLDRRAPRDGLHHRAEPFINLADLGRPDHERPARDRHRHRPVLASDQARRRSGNDRRHHRRPARHRHRPRRLQLRIRAPHARPRRLERRPADARARAGDQEAVGRRLCPRGRVWSFPTTTSAPKPMQQPHPPIWIAARDPNSHDFAVANGCNVQVTPLWRSATRRSRA